MVQACTRHPRIGSKRPVALFFPCQVCPSPLGELQGTCQLPRPCRDPKKRPPQNSLGCRIINTLCTCALQFTSGRGAQRAPTAPARPGRRLGHRSRKVGPVVPRRRKTNESAAAAQCGFSRSLPHSASWFPQTAPTALLPLSTCARPGTEVLTRWPRPRETNLASASAPPLPAARAPTANQRAGRSPPTPPREAGLEQGLAALAMRLANQLAEHTEGEERRPDGTRRKVLGHPPIKMRPRSRAPLPRPLVTSLWKPREATVTLQLGAGAKS